MHVHVVKAVQFGQLQRICHAIVASTPTANDGPTRRESPNEPLMFEPNLTADVLDILVPPVHCLSLKCAA
eukprot:15305299-Alexandrium_andersonii.AAC.1